MALFELERLTFPEEHSNSWAKTVQGQASAPECRAALNELASLWRYASSDPRLYNEFLLSKGVDKRRPSLSASTENEVRTAFGKLIAERLRVSEELLPGALRCDAQYTLARIQEFPTELKQIAYSYALSTPIEEISVLALCSLSEEPQDVREQLSLELPNTMAAGLFKKFLVGQQNPFITQLLVADVRPDDIGLDFVLWLTNKAPEQLLESVAELQEQAVVRLTDVSQHFVGTLPRTGFGRFVSARCAMYLCIRSRARAASPSVAWSKYRDLLEMYAGYELAKFVSLLGESALVESIKRLPPKLEGAADEYGATLIDCARVLEPQALNPKLLTALQRSGDLSGLASLFALLQTEGGDPKMFVRALKTGVRQDASGRLSSWIVRNPSTLRFLNSRDVNPKQAARLATAATKESEAAVRALLELASRAAEGDSVASAKAIVEQIADKPEYGQLAVEFMTEVLFRKRFAVKDLLESPAIRRSIVQQLSVISTRLSQDDCTALLDSIRPIPREEGRALLTQAANVQQRLWAADFLVPLLLEDGCVSPVEIKNYGDFGFAARVLRNLARLWSENIRRLNAFETDWHRRRDQLKQAALLRVRASLEALIQSEIRDLSRRGMNLKADFENWVRENTPSVKYSASTAWRFQQNLAPDLNVRSISAPGELVNIIALHPQLIEKLKAYSSEGLPSLPNAVEITATEYIAAVRSWKKAKQELEKLSSSVPLDLAIRLRQQLEDTEVALAPYFLFRNALEEIGLERVLPSIGSVVEERDLSSSVHKVHREGELFGRLHAYSMGLRVNKDVVGSVVVLKSGDPDDSH